MQKIKVECGSLAWAVKMLMNEKSVCLEEYINTRSEFFLSYYENGKMSDILENDKYKFSFCSSFFSKYQKGWRLYKKSFANYEVLQEKDIEVVLGSLPWAIQMLVEGKKITHEAMTSEYYLYFDGARLLDELGNNHFFNGFDFWHYQKGWQLAA